MINPQYIKLLAAEGGSPLRSQCQTVLRGKRQHLVLFLPRTTLQALWTIHPTD